MILMWPITHALYNDNPSRFKVILSLQETADAKQNPAIMVFNIVYIKYTWSERT